MACETYPCGYEPPIYPMKPAGLESGAAFAPGSATVAGDIATLSRQVLCLKDILIVLGDAQLSAVQVLRLQKVVDSYVGDRR